VAQRAHGMGEPGGKGAVLADALAHPAGFTLKSALVQAQSIAPMFVVTMLQTASVADRAPAELPPAEVMLMVWGADAAHHGGDGDGGDGSGFDDGSGGDGECAVGERTDGERGGYGGASPPTPEGALASSGVWTESSWLGSRTLAEGDANGKVVLAAGANPRLDALIALRGKPRIGEVHLLTADTTIHKGHGQVHSKLFILNFLATDGSGRECVRLVISSANAQAGSYGGVPDHRELCGLWWADFEVFDAPQPLSPFRSTLLNHVEKLFASKPRHRAGSPKNRRQAEQLWRRMCATWVCADTAPADAADTTLVSHVPGVFPLEDSSGGEGSSSGSGSGSSSGAVPMGIVALRECFQRALKTPDERLDLAVIAHCASGWSQGGDGAERFAEWCASAAPNGGRVAFHWPRRADVAILGTQLAGPLRTGYRNCTVPEWLKALPLVELVLREDVIARGERNGYQAKPHLMLYVLHEPLQVASASGAAPAPVVRRMLLTSANLSAAPWGYARDGKLEIRNFELGVCVAPERPLDLVEPLGEVGRAPPEVWARALPFHIERREPCVDPYVSRALVRKADKAEKGHLNY
jgi:hypothetical protein